MINWVAPVHKVLAVDFLSAFFSIPAKERQPNPMRENQNNAVDEISRLHNYIILL